MNKQIIIGNLTRDPETGTTPQGIHYTRFTVAARRRYKKDGQPDAVFFRVTAWRALGETCAKYLSKGKKVAVTGELDVSAYTGNDGHPYATLELTADDVEFLSPKGGESDADERDQDPE